LGDRPVNDYNLCVISPGYSWGLVKRTGMQSRQGVSPSGRRHIYGGLSLFAEVREYDQNDQSHFIMAYQRLIVRPRLPPKYDQSQGRDAE